MPGEHIRTATKMDIYTVLLIVSAALFFIALVVVFAEKSAYDSEAPAVLLNLLR